MTPSELCEVLKKTWANGLEPAVHVIGDQAAHEVAQVIYELSKAQNISTFHLEHAELLRPETIQLLKQLPVVIHFQPCHWHTDKHWLREKIGELARYAFPISQVQTAGIPFYFGSDSPVEEASIFTNESAILDMQREGYVTPKTPFYESQIHPDKNWVSNTWTEFENGKTYQVYFNDRKIYSSDH